MVKAVSLQLRIIRFHCVVKLNFLTKCQVLLVIIKPLYRVKTDCLQEQRGRYYPAIWLNFQPETLEVSQGKSGFSAIVDNSLSPYTMA